MGYLTHILKQQAYIITFTTDKWGDQIPQSSTPVNCRFRYITELDKQTNREGLDSNEALIWFEADENVSEGSIVSVDDVYWRVDRLIKARKLSGTTKQFLKAFVNRHELSEDFS